MNPLDPLEGICPAQHPDTGDGCDRGRGHEGGIHHASVGGFFAVPFECKRCIKPLTEVRSMAGALIGRRCPTCGRLAEP